MRKIIIDTDIGGDIDDVWALVLMLSTNLFDVKMISVTQGDIEYQVKLVAKILQKLNKTHIPIARGLTNYLQDIIYPQQRWIDDFDLTSYEGKIYDTYDEAYEDILSVEREVTLVALAPFTSLATVVPILKKHNIKVVSMAGSINIGYFDRPYPDPECNIVSDIEASKIVFTSGLDITLLPLDVCNNLLITKDNYKTIRNGVTPHCKVICENYDIWQEDYVGGAKKFDISYSSSILYDLAPVLYLLFPQNFDVIEKDVYVDDRGFTVIGGVYKMNIALKVHKVNAMLHFASEQYCTMFALDKAIRQLQVEGRYRLTYSLRKCNVMLSVVEYGWEQKSPGSAYGPSERDYYILHFVTKGKGKLIVGDYNFDINEGDCFLIPPKLTTFYEACKVDPYQYYWVGFDGLEAKELLKKAGLIVNNNYVIKPKDFDAVLKRFKDVEVTSDKKYVAPYQLVGSLYLLLSELIDEDIIPKEEVKDYVDLAIKYISLNYHKDITVDTIAKIIGIDRTYFYRLFTETMKISPKNYLTNLRLEKAKVLLCNTTMSINEVALSVGYVNYASFIKIFKEKYGVTPTIYRNKNT